MLIFGNQLFELSIQNMDFNPITDHLKLQQVKKYYRINNTWVHLEIQFFLHGIIKSSGDEFSLKNGLSQFFKHYNSGTIETNKVLIGTWKERGYFYLFYPQSMDVDGFLNPLTGKACVLRFNNLVNLYKAFMMNTAKDEETSWFEIRKCDFSLSLTETLVSLLFVFCTKFYIILMI